jgi:hypothetical protein
MLSKTSISNYIIIAGKVKFFTLITDYTSEFGGKPWKYILIPHDQVNKTNSFKGVVLNNIYKK